MAITTFDEIKKQLTVIFGSKTGLISPEIEVGDIIGIGKLSAKRTKILIRKTLNFLYAYNAMLEDYAGCKLFSIEFELINMDEKNAGLRIMPKSMLLIPGEYKDCITSLLLLSPEMSLLDNRKAKKSVNKLGKLYFEVEEAINRPELDRDQRAKILSQFAHRFALIVQGNVIEGKWQKRLVGIKDDILETESTPYLNAIINKTFSWKDKEIIPINYKFRNQKLGLNESEEFEFLKYSILNSTLSIILKNSFKLTSNLFKIANTGTVDDLQNQMLIIILSYYTKLIKMDLDEFSLDLIFDKFCAFLDKIMEDFEMYEDICVTFFKSGMIDSLEKLIASFRENIFMQIEKFDKNKKEFLENLTETTILELNRGRYESKKKVRSMEFQSILLYVKENFKIVLKSIKKAIPQFKQNYSLLKYSKILIGKLLIEFDSQKKPIKALGIKYLKKYSEYLKNKIDGLTISGELEDKDSFSLFKKISEDLLSEFFNDVNIGVVDLLGFVEIMHSDNENLTNHIKKIQKMPGELHFLWSLILRASSLQRYLQNIDPEEEFTPAYFIDTFLDFIKKRLAAFPLEWKELIFDWFLEFKRRKQPKYDKSKDDEKQWKKIDVIKYFLEFFEEKIQIVEDIESFKEPMNDYIKKQMMNIENRYLNEIAVSYDMSLELIEQIPDYIRQIFLKVIEDIDKDDMKDSIVGFFGNYPSLELMMSDFEKQLNIVELENLKKPEQTMSNRPITDVLDEVFQIDGFYDYILDSEMKYFSKLYAQPTRIIIKNADPRFSDPSKQIFHQIEFKYFKKFMRAMISTDLKKIRSYIINN